MARSIKMLNLQNQYLSIKDEIDAAIQDVIESSAFINGGAVNDFSSRLAKYNGVNHVIPCGNGTDALQIAYMALGLNPGDEIIMPSFNYVASAEAAVLLKLKPAFVDVEEDTFLIDPSKIENLISKNTKAIVAVHLFGQSANMEKIEEIAAKNDLFIIEDNAQALGCLFKYSNGKKKKTGSIGTINTTSFFPTKTLGCFGDGGAIFTNDNQLAEHSTKLTKHGQSEKYMYEFIGCNSRLDTLQAAILNVKLKYLNENNTRREKAASYYNMLLAHESGISLPAVTTYSSHVYHQYVVKIKNGKRDLAKKKLAENGIQSMIYYPKPLHLQQAYKFLGYDKKSLPVSEKLCNEILALPVDPFLEKGDQEYIVETLKKAIH